MRPMLKIILPAILVAVVVALSGTVNAGTQQEQAAKVLTGKIASVDATKNTIDVKDAGGKTVSLSVNQQTTLMKEGKAITLSDLKAGDNVSVEWIKEGDNTVAKSVTVQKTKGE